MSNSPANHDSPANPLSQAQREQLVAYLDGELSAEESRAIESQLSSSGSVRKEMQRLDKIWHALDDLPQVTVDDRFSRSTVELITQDAEQQVSQLTTAMPQQRRQRRWGAWIACLATAMVGFVLMRAAATSEDRRLLQQLPVIYGADALQQFQSVAYLQALADDPRMQPLIAEKSAEMSAKASNQSNPPDQWQTLESNNFRERAAWVRALPPGEKARLHDAAGRFNRMPAAARQQTEQLYAKINQADNEGELRRVAVAYQAWLATQPPGVQSELRQINDISQRIDRVHNLYQRERRESERSLSAEDSRAMRQAIKGLAESAELTRFRVAMITHLESLKKRLSGDKRGSRFVGQIDGRMRMIQGRARQFPAWQIAVLGELAGGKPGMYAMQMKRLFPEEFDQVQSQAAKDWQAVEVALVTNLSDEAQASLTKIKEPSRRIDRIRGWVLEAAREALEPEDIEAFFGSDSLTDEERHRLLALPTEPMRNELRRLYIDRELGGFDPEMMRGPRGRGPNGRKPGGSDRPGGPPDFERRRQERL